MKASYMIIVAIALVVATAIAAENVKMVQIHEDVNRDSVFAKINAVTVLQFTTDRPASEIRVILDGKSGERRIIQTISTNLLLAIVPMPQEIEIHVRAGDNNVLLVAPLPIDVHDNVGDREYFGPGRNLVLTKWTPVYSITRMTIEGKVLNTLNIEIK